MNVLPLNLNRLLSAVQLDMLRSAGYVIIRRSAIDEAAAKIDLDASPVLADSAAAVKSPAVTISDVITATSLASAITTNDLTGRSRSRAVAWPRQVAMALAYELTGKSTAVVGREFDDRNHTTVFHSTREVRHRVERGHDETIDLIAGVRRHLPRVIAARMELTHG